MIVWGLVPIAESNYQSQTSQDFNAAEHIQDGDDERDRWVLLELEPL